MTPDGRKKCELAFRSHSRSSARSVLRTPGLYQRLEN